MTKEKKKVKKKREAGSGNIVEHTTIFDAKIRTLSNIAIVSTGFLNGESCLILNPFKST